MVLNDLYRCGVCASSCTWVIPLLEIHQKLVEKLYNVLKIFVSPYDFPKYACKDCLDKIETFDNLLAELIKGQEHFYAFDRNMLHDLDATGKKSKTETHDFDCHCEVCGEKCGLKLLAEVIEQKETEEMKNLPSSVAAQSFVISEPSTSTAMSSGQKTKQMECTYCGKMFSHKGDMNKHLRTHTGEQPFSCHICQRKFKHTSNLKRHLSVHSGDKPYKCELCGRKFNRKDKMESHRKNKICKKQSSQEQDAQVL